MGVEMVANKKRHKEHIKCQKVSTEEIMEALTVNSGFLGVTAAWLGRLKTEQKKAEFARLGRAFDEAKDKVTITRHAIEKRIQNNEALTKHKANIDEAILDTGEIKLLSLVNEGNLGAICFLLKCKGKKRGYIERQEVTGADGAPLVPEKPAKYDLSGMSPSELSEAVREAFKKEAGGEKK